MSHQSIVPVDAWVEGAGNTTRQLAFAPPMGSGYAASQQPTYSPFPSTPRHIRPPSHGSSAMTESTRYSAGFSATQSVNSEYTQVTHDTAARQELAYPMPMSGPGTPLLPCEFVGLGGCDEKFGLDETEVWIHHITAFHLRDHLPSKVDCWFCDDFRFNAQNVGNDRSQNFRQRLMHVREHILTEGMTEHDMRPDYDFARHLHKYNLISDEVLAHILNWHELPCPRSHLDHIRPPGFVPPERARERERAVMFIIDDDWLAFFYLARHGKATTSQASHHRRHRKRARLFAN
ncbi:hypothetical protein GGS23DRAFT_97187 [Durotheca rogersii]|uniref:uncharacterized protein n=1 Tax=Durotheca rogersii TaxID=419775 RepID=UPI0022203457|nr:uncharacterized protein GGS23DRAFT_97187 [Durotheca rogersii]KAI5862371.1 hypothetical protein GGS23DRAFT_97187 [Durotheca rogersii]